MSISVTCSECFMDFTVPERFAGKKIKCKSCGAAIPVPKPGAAAEPDELDDFGPAFSPPGLPPRPGQNRPAAPAASAPRKKGSNVWIWVGGIAGGIVLAVLLCCGGPLFLLKRATTKVDVAEYPDLPDFGEPTTAFPVAQIPVPKFPDLGPATAVGDKGVQTHEIDLSGVQGNEGWPGMKMKMRVYLPAGEHAAKSLPCVLVGPAGSTLLEGMDIDGGDYHDETLPYAEAGMAVITYSLDGGSEMMFNEEEEEVSLKAPYLHFRAACAGVVNVRNALEFATAKLPMVDPKKVYAAGHSSAGTLSLLAAAHEPRLAGVLAYAPAVDVPGRMEGVEDAPTMLTGLMYPRLKEFLTQSSPTTHASAIKCPVFLYHSKEDENTPFADSEKFANSLKTTNKDVTFVAGEPGAAGAGDDAAADPAAGGEMAEELADEEYSEDEEYYEDEYGYGVHYTSMKEEGLPKGVEWLKSRTGLAM